MSSKRGRKRNDDLPPNRARDVQRAFRARRAAHLRALEERVSELEEENDKLRQMVGWPPDDRPPLGKGPTGKDKPKSLDSGGGTHAIGFFSQQDSESPGSSPDTSSHSRSKISGSSRGLHDTLDPETWENAYTMDDPNDQLPESPYDMPPLTAPVSRKPMYPPYGGGLPSSLPASSSRPIGTAYMTSSATYSQSTERHMGGSYSSPSFVGRAGEMRVDSPRQHFSYQAHSYEDHDQNMGSQSPPRPSTSTTMSHSQHPHAPLHQRDAPTPFVHRRAVTEQYSMHQGVHLPDPAQLPSHQTQRHLDQHRMHEGSSEHQHHQQQQDQPQHAYRLAPYGPDGRINSMAQHDGL